MSKIKIECENCNKEFRAYPSQDRKLCSWKCFRKWWSKKRTGKKLSKEHKKSISKTLSGRDRGGITWIEYTCQNCGKRFKRQKQGKEYKFCSKECYYQSMKGQRAWNKGLTAETDERVKKNTEAIRGVKKDFSNYRGKKHHFYGNKHSEEVKKKISKAHKGKKLSKETKKKISRAQSGKNNNNWKDGISKKKDYEKILKERSPQFHLSRNFSGQIWRAIKKRKAGRHWENLVDYTLKELKQRLECQFKEGMSWENYGEWHVDHKKPKSKFDYEKAEDQAFKDCWSLANLQPLWAEENLRKSNNF